ncbi:unnamed protein product [Darwinula stevensoni]|uniref:GB1/RHD3-type G domain-containing protein n=1 Tax=Darwinula stevensoni TaxID=69355 RepID=A0A7R8X6H3_9CRUS|nr:unnamed protein product [Darwinula stevensoni]CAG0888198.1 unnamed protein product [Darwinula stevensoni]
MARGSAVCVVERTEGEDGDSYYTLKEGILRSILLQEHCKDKPVAVVSIAGGARRGKSFLLSLFLRYLKGEGSDRWLGDEDTPVTGFAWKMSARRVTTGIHIWDEIIPVKLPGGEEACIILMDTEGTFDCEEPLGHSVTVFALSTLLSSLQIYNLKDNIQMDDLLHLQFFTGYGRLCLEEREEKPFQSFLFLVRDWRNNHEYHYGNEGGREFLDDKLQTSGKQREEVKSVKEDIKCCFADINCFLMPYPGEKVAGDPHFNGYLSDINEDFREQLQHLVPMLLSPENFVLKKVAGKAITCQELFEYFKCYVTVYNNREEIPEPRSILEATADVQHRNACDEATKKYQRRMDGLLEENPVPTQKRLDEMHARHKAEAIQIFTSSKKMGGKELSERYRHLLEKEYGQDMAAFMRNIPLVTKEVLQLKHQEKRKEAIQTFQEMKEMANEDLFYHCKERLEKDVETQSKTYITDRQWREGKAVRELINAVQAIVWKYSSHMGRFCGEAVITEEELRIEHEKYCRQAFEDFFNRTENTPCPYFLNEHQDNLKKRLDEQYKVYVELRQSKERKAETELMNATEAATGQYNDEICGLLERSLMSEEELRKGHEDCHRRAIEALSDVGNLYPFLLKKHKDELEKVDYSVVWITRLANEYERHKRAREAQEKAAEAVLEDAVGKSVIRYEMEMARLCGEFVIKRLIRGQELGNGHAKYREEAHEMLRKTGEEWPHLANKYKDELEKRLMTVKDEFERGRDSSEEKVRSFLENEVKKNAKEYIGPNRMNKFYGETVVGREELLENHKEHRNAVIRRFQEAGNWAPDWLLEEYEHVLANTLNSWHRELEKKMGEERNKRAWDKQMATLATATGSMMAGTVFGPGSGAVAATASGAVGGAITQYIGNSRWRNNAVLPDLNSICIESSEVVSPSLEEEESEETEEP